MQQDSIFHLRLTSKLSKGMLSPRFTPECIKWFASVGENQGAPRKFTMISSGLELFRQRWSEKTVLQFSGLLAIIEGDNLKLPYGEKDSKVYLIKVKVI